MITVGYGDIPANNLPEQILSIAAMFTGVIFFSLTIGTLTSLIADIDSKNVAYENKLNTLVSLSQEHHVSNDVFNQVNLILKYGIYKKVDTYNDFLAALPEKLAIDLANVIYGSVVKGIAFFESIFLEDSDRFLAAVGPYLKTTVFTKGEVVWSEHEYAREMYFIKKGMVAYVIPEANNLPFMKVSQGNYFGEIDVIFRETRRFHVIAYTDLELIFVEEEPFHKIFMHEFSEVGNIMKSRAQDRRL